MDSGVGRFTAPVFGFGHHDKYASPRRSVHVLGDELNVQVCKFFRLCPVIDIRGFIGGLHSAGGTGNILSGPA